MKNTFAILVTSVSDSLNSVVSFIVIINLVFLSSNKVSDPRDLIEGR